MALEAADSGGDVSRSNMWGLNFILGLVNNHLISTPIKLLLIFKALQFSLNGAAGLIQSLLVKIFVSPATNLFFEGLDM